MLAKVRLLVFPPPLWGHKISPELLPCTLGLDCGLSPAGAAPVLWEPAWGQASPVSAQSHSWPARESELLADFHWRRGEFSPGQRASTRRNSVFPRPPRQSGHQAEATPPCGALPNPVPAFIQVHLPLFPPSLWGHKISPEQLPCSLGLGCEYTPVVGSACVSIDCLRKGRPSVSEVPAQQGNLTWYQKIQ